MVNYSKKRQLSVILTKKRWSFFEEQEYLILTQLPNGNIEKKESEFCSKIERQNRPKNPLVKQKTAKS